MEENKSSESRRSWFLRSGKAILIFTLTFLLVSFCLDAVGGREWEVDPYAVIAGLMGVVAALLLKRR